MPFGPFILQWRAPSPNPPNPTPIPPGFTRTYIPTSSGPLELLSILPSSSPDPSQPHAKPPLFFAHGGFGCAAVWIPYMQFFAARGYPCYAVSYRGHGGSWYPGFFRMYITTRGKLVADLVDGIKFVEKAEGERRGGGQVKVVLVAHSNGGQLAQYALSRGLVGVSAFCMFAAVPGFGSFSCYKFWAPTAIIHMWYRFFHPRYVAATTKQIKDAFFLPSTPVSLVKEFERLLSPYESMPWAPQGLFAFVTGPDVLRSIANWRVGGADRMFVLAAERDVLCTPAILRDAAARYRAGLDVMVKNKEIEGEASKDWEGVRFRVVEGMPHHLQNSEGWERGAGELLEWVEQL